MLKLFNVDHFLPVADKNTQIMFAEITNHVVCLTDKSQANIACFLSKADPWLIAKASTICATIVTHEALVPPNSKKVKIPNICKQFGVSYMNTRI